VVNVTIRDAHTHITEITKDGQTIFERDDADIQDKERQTPFIHRFTLRQMLHYAQSVPIEELLFIRQAYDLNLALFEQALQNRRTTFAHYLYKKNGERVISDDEQASASLLCNAAIEARVLGLSRPAMSITGSGAHGIIATLPLYAAQQVNGYTDEQLLRATALSYLVCMYIKEYSGKLSAFCGCAIAAGTGMACGLAFLRGGTHKTLTLTIQNMASSITGMICDGGNHGCTMKGIVAVDAAYRSVAFAQNGIAIGHEHGINGHTPEDTMRNMGLIASPGMVKTEGVIVDIMREKTKRLK
jgi:L-cysteine desulfidase